MHINLFPKDQSFVDYRPLATRFKIQLRLKAFSLCLIMLKLLLTIVRLATKVWVQKFIEKVSIASARYVICIYPILLGLGIIGDSIIGPYEATWRNP